MCFGDVQSRRTTVTKMSHIRKKNTDRSTQFNLNKVSVIIYTELSLVIPMQCIDATQLCLVRSPTVGILQLMQYTSTSTMI